MYKRSNYKKPDWIKPEEDRVTYFVGSAGWEDEQSAIDYAKMTGQEIEIYYPQLTQMDLFK